MKNRFAAFLLGLLTLAYTAALIYYPGVILASVKAFTQARILPNAENLREVFSFMLFSYPVPIVIAYFSWAAYHKRRFKAAYWLVLLPVIWVAATAVFLLAATLIEH